MIPCWIHNGGGVSYGRWTRLATTGLCAVRGIVALNSKQSVVALAVAFILSVGTSSYADQTGQQASTSKHPPPTTRCKSLDIALVHATYAGFERAITVWMATCVTSRSGDAHREVELVHDNRSLPEAEKAISDVITSAKPHVPPAGSGVDWHVLDQVVNGTVPAQLDGAACGPGCLAMLLAERGIKIAQQELLRRARATIPQELKSKRIGIQTLLSLLKDVDPAGKWTGGRDISNVLRGRNALQVMERLGRRGSWIAQVGTHFVVIDKFEGGYLYVRDPWYEPARSRGINSGSSYRVSLRTFLDYWYVAAIYRE